MEGFCQIYRVEESEFENAKCKHCGQGQNVHSIPDNAEVLAVLLKERRRSGKKKRKVESELEEELARSRRRAARFLALARSLLDGIEHRNGDYELVDCFSLTEETVGDFRPAPAEDQEYHCHDCEDSLCILAELGPKEREVEEGVDEEVRDAQFVPYTDLVNEIQEIQNAGVL